MGNDHLTPKQEKFAQKYIETGNAAEAYRLAYDAENMKPVTIRRKAAELLEHGNVSAHIARLRETHQKRHNVTIDSLTIELDEDRQLAREINQPGAAINAVMGKAKLHGLLTDKAEISGPNGVAPSIAVTVTSDLVKSIVQQVRDEF